MSERVRITDVSPRDGLQNERGVVDTESKVRLIELLSRCGVDEVEVSSFVSAKWVPQLADAEKVIEEIRAVGLGCAGMAPMLSVLVPNEKGFERAMAMHSEDWPLKIALFTAASESFSRKNTNASIGESIERFRPIVPRALELGMPVRMYVSCAVACPFEGPTPPARVRAVVDELLSLAPANRRDDLEIDLGDTIGVAHPADIAALLGAFDRAMPGRMTLHLHDTFGRAAECVAMALEMGVRSFDGAAGGLGGCPFASVKGKRAPGNISTELLVSTVQKSGFETLVKNEALRRAAAFAEELVHASRLAAGNGR